MPLSPPAPREHLHTRIVTCQGFRRADGLWDIEGHMTDVKTYGFKNQYRGEITPGDPLHEMWLRLTVDDNLLIKAIEAETDRSPFAICPAITPQFQRLVGLRIAAGFTNKVKELLGGVQGCTHLVELMGPVATTAFQTVFPLIKRPEAPPDAPKRPPALLDSCHAFASDGEVVRRAWPDFFTGPKREG